MIITETLEVLKRRLDGQPVTGPEFQAALESAVVHLQNALRSGFNRMVEEYMLVTGYDESTAKKYARELSCFRPLPPDE